MTAIIYLDLETTGLDKNSEFVQIAIIDDDEKILLNSLSKPVKNKTWSAAERIHGITPRNVKNAPTNDELKRTIIDICTDKIVVIYNASYDMQYLDYIKNVVKKIHCCMHMFAKFNGNWSDYHGNYQWCKLTHAMTLIGEEMHNAHNALADCIATRKVYRYINKKQSEYELLNKKTILKQPFYVKYHIEDIKHKKIYMFNYYLNNFASGKYRYQLLEYIANNDAYNKLMNTLIENGIIDSAKLDSDNNLLVESDINNEYKLLIQFLLRNDINKSSSYKDKDFKLNIEYYANEIIEYEYEVKNIKNNEIYNVKYLLDVEIDDDDHDINTKYELATDDCSDDLVYFLKQHESQI